LVPVRIFFASITRRARAKLKLPFCRHAASAALVTAGHHRPTEIHPTALSTTFIVQNPPYLSLPLHAGSTSNKLSFIRYLCFVSLVLFLLFRSIRSSRFLLSLLAAYQCTVFLLLIFVCRFALFSPLSDSESNNSDSDGCHSHSSFSINVVSAFTASRHDPVATTATASRRRSRQTAQSSRKT